MKKILIIMVVSVFICGCSSAQTITKSEWPDIYPTYNGTIKEIQKKDTELTLTGVNKTDVDVYFDEIKKDYTSVIVDNDTNYQASNSSGKMISIKYDKDNNTLTIKEGN